MAWKLPLLLLLAIGSIYVIRTGKGLTPYQQEEGMIFGTYYHVTYQCDSSLQAGIERELGKVDASLSTFNKASVISRINTGSDKATDSMFRHVFTLAQEVSTATNGAFDITVAPLVNAWGFGFKNREQVTPVLIDSLLTFVGYHKVSLQQDRLQRDDPRTVLDCSAIAKGYGSDVVAAYFDRKGIRNYMIEIGGEIVLKGQNPKQKPWRVGISKPTEDSISTNNGIEATLELTNIAMATSGNYRNFYYKDGKKYAHTIDPHTGYPVQHSILSSTVLAPTCAMADAYATAFMVLGLDSARAVLQAHPELQAYFIYTDKDGNYSTYMTPDVEKRLLR